MQPSAKFEKNVRTIARKNRRIARGHTTYIDETGILRKRATESVASGLPIKGLLTMVLGFILFKSVVLASIGEASYGQRLDLLTSGTPFEQVGAWALGIDPVTAIIGGMLNPLF